MGPLITIAIPTFNRCELLERTLKSIFNQKLDNVEVLVSDNASTDNTEEMIKAKYPSVNYIKNDHNIGPDANFLQCYEKANGEYVWLLGSDDLVIDGAFDKVADFIKSIPKNQMPKVVLVNISTFKDNGNINLTDTPFKKTSGSILTTDKNQIIDIVKTAISFMSCFMISKQEFNKINDAQSFIDTSFIHSCIAFEMTNDPDSNIGVIFEPCIAQDLTFGNSEMSKKENLPIIYTVMLKRMYHALCEIAPQYGYSRRLFYRYYIQWVNSNMPRTVLSMKAQKINGWKETFLRDGYPYIKSSPVSWIKVILPAILFPQKLAELLYNIKHKSN